MRIYWLLGVTGSVFALDHLSKRMIMKFMHLYESIPVIGEEFFRLTYVENDGIAFGIAFGGRTFLIIVTFLAVVFLIYYILRMRQSPPVPQVALSIILGGALGNLYDRVFVGKVVDFLDFDFPDLIMNRWPVFNIADSSVTVGMTILIIYLLFFDAK
jgi:signal peptidase II